MHGERQKNCVSHGIHAAERGENTELEVEVEGEDRRAPIQKLTHVAVRLIVSLSQAPS